jgi:hypothetical protein
MSVQRIEPVHLFDLSEAFRKQHPQSIAQIHSLQKHPLSVMMCAPQNIN